MPQDIETLIYPQQVLINAENYGFKTANLMYLRDNLNLPVPSFIGISNHDIITHINNHLVGSRI